MLHSTAVFQVNYLKMKRAHADDEAAVLLVTTSEDAVYACYTAPLSLFTAEELPRLHQSMPSMRANVVPGCRSGYGQEDMYDSSVWAHVEQDDVPELANVRKVVLAYAYE